MEEECALLILILFFFRTLLHSYKDPSKSPRSKRVVVPYRAESFVWIP